jgi:hypothetical protein
VAHSKGDASEMGQGLLISISLSVPVTDDSQLSRAVIEAMRCVERSCVSLVSSPHARPQAVKGRQWPIKDVKNRKIGSLRIVAQRQDTET